LVYSIEQGYSISFRWDRPLLISALLNDYETDMVQTMANAGDTDIDADATTSEASATDGQAPNATDTASEDGTTASGDAGLTDGQETAVNVSVTKYKKRKKRKAKSPYYKDAGKTALTTDYPYISVGADYYADALFIGDSRIAGLAHYSGLTEATFCYKEGLTVYDMMSEPLSVTTGASQTKVKKRKLKSVLKQGEYTKIYIMIGINELGDRTTQAYAAQYEKHLATIHQYQPDAMVVVMAIMNVTTKYAKENEVFNNDNINAKNVAISAFANGQDTIYIDVNPELNDKYGGMKEKYSWDGVHLKAEYYQLWVDFLNSHGVRR
jgi:hypothetical protein